MANGMKNKVYEFVTEQVIGLLEKGTVPWRRPWVGGYGVTAPVSGATGKLYRGINYFMLDAGEYLTFKQITERGGKIKKGEKGQMVVFYKIFENIKENEDGESETKKFPFLRYYNVWEVSQTEGITRKHTKEEADGLPDTFQAIQKAENILFSYPARPKILHKGSEAFYTPGSDTVTMPTKRQFLSDESYYSTLFHELAHSTGAKHRLNREGVTGGATFGSDVYATEEVIAEMASTMLCGMAGIAPQILDNNASYLNYWIRKLKEDPKVIVRLGSAGQKAADYVQGITYKEG